MRGRLYVTRSCGKEGSSYGFVERFLIYNSAPHPNHETRQVEGRLCVYFFLGDGIPMGGFFSEKITRRAFLCLDAPFKQLGLHASFKTELERKISVPRLTHSWQLVLKLQD
jgi:hypothetical protein